MSVVKSWGKFIENFERRLKTEGYVKEETFRTDYILALSYEGISSQGIWPEQPYPNRQKTRESLDLLVKNKGKECIKIRFLRQLQIGYTYLRQFQASYGLAKLISDVYRLTEWIPGDYARKFLLCIMDSNFEEYLKEKRLYFPSEGTSENLMIDLKSLPKTTYYNLEPEIKKKILSGQAELEAIWKTLRKRVLNDLTIRLIEIL